MIRPKNQPRDPRQKLMDSLLKQIEEHLPKNVNAEFSLCGGFIDSHADVAEIRNLVSPSDFTIPELGKLFQHIIDRFDAGEPRMTMPLAHTILGTEHFETLRDLVKKAELLATNLRYHAKAVADASKRRQAIDLNLKAAACLEAKDVDVDKVVGRLVAALESIGSPGESEFIKPVPKIMKGYLDSFENVIGNQPGVSTCIPEIDEHYGELLPGQLVCLGGRTSNGKTQWALQIAMRAVERNQAVLFLTLEMNASELLDRVCGPRAGINPGRLAGARSRQLDAEELFALREAANEVGQLPLTIYEPPSATIQSLRGVSRVWKSKTDNAALIVVDYLQLMQPTDSGKNRNEQVAEISRGLKSLAREMELPVLALCQLNRQADTTDGPPQLSMLRESGTIEQDSDKVFFVYRPNFENEHGYRVTRNLEDAQIIIAKNRGNAMNAIDVQYQQCIGFKPRALEPIRAFDEFNSEF